MSLLVSLFIFFLCLSLHACNARLFGVIDKGPIAVQFHFSIEDGEKAKSLDHLNPSIGGGTDKDGTIDKSNGGASTTQQPKDSINKLSGTEIFESSSNVSVLSKGTRTTEESRRRALSVESGAHQVKAAVKFSNGKAQDEVAVTDYNSPHQTPPIHNRQT